MTWQQLDLFADAGGPAARPFYGVTVCPWCGQPLVAVPIDDPGDPWQPAALFGYIEQTAHDRQHHPERGTPVTGVA